MPLYFTLVRAKIFMHPRLTMVLVALNIRLRGKDPFHFCDGNAHTRQKGTPRLRVVGTVWQRDRVDILSESEPRHSVELGSHYVMSLPYLFPDERETGEMGNNTADKILMGKRDLRVNLVENNTQATYLREETTGASCRC